MKREDSIVNSAIQKALRAGVSGPKASCPDDNRLNAYLENRLSQHERDRTEAHLAGCSQCQEIVSLSITLAAPESEVVDETSPHPRKTVLFRLSLPLSALALIIVGVAAGILFFRTPDLRKAGEATQMADAERHRPAPLAAPETPSLKSSEDLKLRDKDATARASSEVRAVERKDDRSRVEQGSGRRNAPAPASPAETGLKRAGTLNENPVYREKEKVDAVALRKSEQRPSGEELAITGPQGVGGETDKRLRTEGMQQKQQAAAPAVQTKTSTFAADIENQKKLSPSPEILLRSFAQQPLESLDKALVSGKLENYGNKNASNVANNRIQPARQLGSKTFYLFSEYWIDSQCREYPNVPVVEVREGEPVLQEMLKAMPEIGALRSANAPVLIHWQEKNYLLRFRSP